MTYTLLSQGNSMHDIKALQHKLEADAQQHHSGGGGTVTVHEPKEVHVHSGPAKTVVYEKVSNKKAQEEIRKENEKIADLKEEIKKQTAAHSALEKKLEANEKKEEQELKD